jgi:hypothetical protein
LAEVITKGEESDSIRTRVGQILHRSHRSAPTLESSKSEREPTAEFSSNSHSKDDTLQFSEYPHCPKV